MRHLNYYNVLNDIPHDNSTDKLRDGVCGEFISYADYDQVIIGFMYRHRYTSVYQPPYQGPQVSRRGRMHLGRQRIHATKNGIHTDVLHDELTRLLDAVDGPSIGNNGTDRHQRNTHVFVFGTK